METVGLGIRAHLRYGAILLFLEQIAPPGRHISTRIHAHVVGLSRGFCRVALSIQMGRVARLSCGFFSAMAENKAGNKNQGAFV